MFDYLLCLINGFQLNNVSDNINSFALFDVIAGLGNGKLYFWKTVLQCYRIYNLSDLLLGSLNA